MATMVSRLLDISNLLIDERSNSSAARRRAISTAYYAVFHALLKICASTFIQDQNVSDETYERAYRALDHAQVRQAFESRASPLFTDKALRPIGDLVVPLLSARNRADYAPPDPHPFSRSEAIDFVDQAREAIARLDSLGTRERLDLVVHLLFKDRGPSDRLPADWLKKRQPSL